MAPSSTNCPSPLIFWWSFVLLAGISHLGAAQVASGGRSLQESPPGPWPEVGAGLGGVNFYATYSPFADVMKNARWSGVASWDERGYPTSANPGEKASALMGIDNADNWPTGQYVLIWEGEGVARAAVLGIPGTQLVSEDLSGTVKRRVYEFDPSDKGLVVKIDQFPVTNVHLYLPGQEEHPSLWNPDYVKYLAPLTGKVFRYMDLGRTNNNEQVGWSDRTPRDWSSYTNTNNPNSAAWKVKGSVSWEAMIELSNELNTDMWICVPHRATDNYVRNLAHLIKTGVDRATGQPTTQPLKPTLRVFLEYSNEVWNTIFQQTKWVDNNVAGTNINDKYVKKAVSVFDAFKSTFRADDRLVRVLATQTTNGTGVYSRTYQRLAAAEYPRDYDAMAVTTYFGYDAQQYLYDNWPVSAEQLGDYLVNQIGSGPFREDDTNVRNETTYWSYWAAEQFGVPLISYEGNEHINAAHRIDTDGDGRKDSFLVDAIPEALDVIQTLARGERMAELLTAYQERAAASGLQMFNAFVLLNGWSKHGQWGFVEYVGQTVEEAVKYHWLLDYFKLGRPNLGPTPNASMTPVSVYAAGRSGTERMELRIDGEVVASWDSVGGDAANRSFVAYNYQATGTVRASQIQVAFVNDEKSRDLRVDRLEVGNTIYQSEDPSTFSTGTWTKEARCTSGFPAK